MELLTFVLEVAADLGIDPTHQKHVSGDRRSGHRDSDQQQRPAQDPQACRWPPAAAPDPSCLRTVHPFSITLARGLRMRPG
jgi:hypothetical protein